MKQTEIQYKETLKGSVNVSEVFARVRPPLYVLINSRLQQLNDRLLTVFEYTEA